MRLSLILFHVFAVSILASAQAQTYKSGDKVMVNSWDAKLTESGKNVNTSVYLGDILTVTEIKADWLWVGRGWIHNTDVVPLDHAIEYFTSQIRGDPTSGALYNRAVAYRKMGDLDKAIADEGEVIRLDAGNSASLTEDYCSRGLMWYAKCEYNSAIVDYNEAIRLDPKCTYAYFNRSQAWIAKREYDRAIKDISDVIGMDAGTSTELAPDYSRRGVAWKGLGNYEKALIDYNEAVHFDQKYTDAYKDLAWILATCPDQKFRDGGKAVESATKACELSNWQNGDDLDTLAASFAEKRDFDSAVKCETKALELKLTPDNDNNKKPEDLRARLELYKSGKPYREELKK
jgi:tetratricopeptide (TPR) repeat protein